MKKWTLFRAGLEFGSDRETLRRRLRKLGLAVGPKKTYTTKEIVTALYNDLDIEKIRETRARADLLERERREKDRELIDLSEVQSLIRESFLPVRQRFLALPSDLAKRCNPTDPLMAREALERWVSESLPLIRDQPKSATVARASQSPLILVNARIKASFCKRNRSGTGTQPLVRGSDEERRVSNVWRANDVEASADLARTESAPIRG